MKRRWLRWTLGGLGAVLLILVAAILWVLNTTSGTRTAIGLAQRALDGNLSVASIDGTLAGPLMLRDLRFVDPASKLSVAVARIDFDAALLALLGMRVHVVNAQVSGLDVMLGPPKEEEPPPQDQQPFSMQAPIDVLVESLSLRDAVVRRSDEELIRIDTAAFAGSWIGTAIDIRQLDVRSPQGEIHFAGSVNEAETYTGTGEGTFSWTAAETTYAGRIEADARDEDTKVELAITSPLRANLNVQLVQKDTLPWFLRLEVPSFDPREELMPESSLESLAATLRGEGTLNRGALQGDIVINGETLRFERIAFERTERRLDLDARLLAGGGALDAQARVRLDAEPVDANVEARWGEITIPEQWASQVLKTEGRLTFEGSAQGYRANGSVRLGPPEQLANIELAVEGSPSAIEVRQFDIVQTDGRLAARGNVTLQPQIGWVFDADAKRFDPGDFATAWPGDLNFELHTDGAIEEAGPRATVQLNNLRGQLRGRALSGTADMQLLPNKHLSGNADLRSGESRVRLQAQSGEVMDALARIDVPSLGDWVPNAGGELRANFTARGTWPELRIEGNAKGRELRLDDLRVGGMQLELNVTNPTAPDGALELRITDAAAAGMEIASMQAQASGNAESHRLELSARGKPLGTDLALSGSMREGAWSGTVQQLILDVQDAARLALERPVDIAYSPEETRVSQACFADGDIRLCFDANLQADGSLDARYSLRAIPLALANAFASADSSLSFSGTIGGEGDIHRNSEGEMRGTARIESSRGEIGQRAAESEPVDVLLSFADLSINADFEADRARARMAARLNETGSLNGELALAGLGQEVTQLEGSLAASLPSIAVIELFAPQLANVQGAVDLRAGVRGTLDEPDIEGALRLTDLAAEVPEFGLRLKNGHLSVTPSGTRTFEIDGGIESGEGQLAWDGTLRLEGASDLSIKGQRFLAANMPGARVIVEPNIDIDHVAERVTVKGQVRIPEADINLQEMPSGTGGGAKVSSDVVVVDAETQEEAQAEALPVYADVTIILGEKVELAGFGLVSQVAGQLAVRERPGEPTAGSGEIRVGGTYKAYGQDLTIEQGSLLFANTPLDNPNLRITATRQVGDVKAGLRVTGNAKSPVLTVFSNPEMGQADALSYLVAGKPLDEIGQGEGEGDAVQTAARSLGTAAGGLLAKNLGKRLGVDEIGIKDDEMIGGSAFTIGQYLSPRLFLGYGVGLFEPGEVVTLRYSLTKALSLQAQRGTDESRAGVEFRIER